MSRVEGGEEANNLLLKDVETINKALYREKGSSTNSTSSKSHLHDPKSKLKASKEDTLPKEKKSIWNWKSLKALSLTRNKKFNCSFSVQVHLIEGLPLSFNDSSLCVHWKRKDALLVTSPAKVIQGVAEFQDILTHTCSISGSRSGPGNSAKYEAKNFLLYASMLGAAEQDLGKNRVDLTRLLPLTLEELEEEKSSGQWTTSFILSGTARGAIMNVSFEYVVVGDNTSATTENHGASPNVFTTRENSIPLINPLIKHNQVHRSVRRTGSLPSFADSCYSSKNVVEVKDLHEVLLSSESARASSVDILYEECDKENTRCPLHDKPEPDVFKEKLDPIKSVVCSSDSDKENPDKKPRNEGKACSLVHDRSEFDVFQENLQTIKLNDYPVSDSGIEIFEVCERNGFSVVDQGNEFSPNERFKLEESIIKAVVDGYTVDSSWTLDTVGIQNSLQDRAEQNSQNELKDSCGESALVHEFSSKKDELCTKEFLLQELESALDNVLELETVAMESPNFMEAESKYNLRKSHSLDDVTESAASEVLSRLGLDHSPMGLSFESETESPRERLLRQFEKEALAGGFSLFDFDTGNDSETDGDYDASLGSEQWEFYTDIKPASLLPDLQKGHLIESEDVRCKPKVKILEELETEALMREWGLNEKAFQHSPHRDHKGFGSPIYLLPEEPLPLPPLAEGLGPFLQTKDGGFLRSMNPSLFKNSRNGGTLIMQVSNPVVVPAEMGSGIMEILQFLASMGIEKLSLQAKKLMPLEDITGKTTQQISWEAKSILEGTHKQYHLHNELVTEQDSTCRQRGSTGTLSGRLKSDEFSSSSVGNRRGSEFVSLEDLAPLAMDKIESLSLEGLRIQSGMSNGDASSNIIAQSFGDISAFQGKGVSVSGSLGLDGAAALQLLDIKDSNKDDGVDGIMGLTLTLEEWMRLDSGEIDDDIDNISEHTFKLLVAHHANSLDIIRESSKGERKQGKSFGRKCGLLGNNFTVALMVQLRNPLRNYEPVGTPMLALIQVERVFVPPRQKMNRRVSEAWNTSYEDDECEEIVAKVEMKANKEDKSSEEEAIPQFRITEVHVAGLKTEPDRKNVWGTSRGRQQESGSRWLIANGMGKSNKNPLLKSKVVSKSSAPITTTNVQPGDTLWSISSRIYGTGTRWKELVALNPHMIRNPNIILPNKTIRVR